MSLYNLINGVNPATFFILPMLGKHPDLYPRFRDCYLDDEGIRICVFTRVGGGNRHDYEQEITELQAMEGYIEDHDWEQDNTYAIFYFYVPEKFKDDCLKIQNSQFQETSQEYKDLLYKVYPKLKEKFDALFNTEVKL